MTLYSCMQLLYTCPIFRREGMIMEKVRIGLVGLNGFAQVHLRSIDNCIAAGLASLDAVVVRPASRNNDNFKAVEPRGLRVYDTLDEMLEAEQGKLDLIAIPTGIDSHAPFSVAALNKGFDVMCEKPAAGTMEDVNDMLEAQRETGKTLVIGFQNLFTPTVQRVKEIRLDGTLGELKEARTKVSWPRDSKYYSRNSWSGKLYMEGKPILDSPLQNATAHFLQNMLYVAGSTKESGVTPVSIYGENYHAQPIESADTQYIRIETEEGPVIQMSSTHACKELHEPETDYLFEKGRIHWERETCEVFRYEDEKEVSIEKLDNYDMDVQKRVFWNVCQDLPAGRTPACTIENSWQQVLCIIKLFESSDVTGIPADYYEIEEKDGGENYHVPGIEKMQDDMFARGIGFAEAGAAWGKAGKKVIAG